MSQYHLLLPIAIEESFQQCLQFRHDAYLCSCGDNHNKQPPPLDSNTYRRWLERKQREDRESVQHLWLDDQIIGQLEMGLEKKSPNQGCLHFCYIVPQFRGKQMANLLMDEADRFFLRNKLTRASLSVSPRNLRAFHFYLKMGWQDEGPRKDCPESHLMTKNLKSEWVNEMIKASDKSRQK